MARFIALIVLSLVVVGCGRDARVQRATRQALPEHLEGLRAPPRAVEHFQVPRERAWNAATSMLEERYGIQSSDPVQGAVLLAWQYPTQLSEDGLVATQRAIQPLVTMVEREPFHYVFEVSGQTLERRRGACAGATDWLPADAPSEFFDEIRESAERAIQRSTEGQWNYLRFEGEPGALIETLSRSLAPYELGESGEGRLTTRWRVTSFRGRRVTVEVKSRIAVEARRLDEGVSALSVQVDVEAGRSGSTRPIDDAAVARRVAGHIWAAAVRDLQPLESELPGGTPRVYGAPPRRAPVLEAPVPRGTGDYDLFVAFTAPAERPDGQPWDSSRRSAPLSRAAPTVARKGVPLMGSPDAAERVAHEAASEVRGGGRRDPGRAFVVAMAMAAMASEAEADHAPDLTVHMSAPRPHATDDTRLVPTFQFPIVENALAAIWSPVRVSLEGSPFVVHYRVDDRDVASDDAIAEGTVDLLDVVRACGHLEVGSPEGGMLRLLAIPAR